MHGRHANAFVPSLKDDWFAASGLLHHNADVNLPTLELDLAVLEREQRIIAADPDVEAGGELGPALPDDDGTGRDSLTTISFDPAILSIAVAAVS